MQYVTKETAVNAAERSHKDVILKSVLDLTTSNTRGKTGHLLSAHPFNMRCKYHWKILLGPDCVHRCGSVCFV